MNHNKTSNAYIEKLIDKIIFYKDYHYDQYYIDKFNTDWILGQISDSEEIQLIDQKIKTNDNTGVDLIDFIRILLSVIEHTEDQRLYIVMSAIDLFKEICENFELENFITCKDLLNYIVEVFLIKTGNTESLQTRKVPDQKKFDVNTNRIRPIDIYAPIIAGDLSSTIRRLMKNKITTDSYHHNDNGIMRAYYANEIKKLFTLDSLSGFISVYNLNCLREKIIKPKCAEDKREIIILDFAWSNRQNRLGCCLKDFMICFWDASDNFEFEKTLIVNDSVSDYQTNMWFIEFLNQWITTDKTHAINGWDIEKETRLFSLTSPKIKRSIIDMVGIEYLKLVAVSSMDRGVSIWDFVREHVVLYIDLKRCGIHSMVFSNTYQTLITVGYENAISLWCINPDYLDHSLVGKLIGHSSMVTAIEVVEKSPMVISADDSGEIKIWDIRTMNCIQNIELSNRMTINKLIDISECNKLCFVGTRVNFLEYDSTYRDNKNVFKNSETFWPIRVDYNFLYKELIVCTRRDLRCIDVETGRIKKIMVGLLANNDDDITKFRLAQQSKKFILGDHRGNLAIYSYSTGEKIKNLQGHSHEITNLKIDHINKLIITSSWDSTVYIQKEVNEEYEIKRKLTNLHYNKEIILLEVSVYHNIMITATSNNVLYIWDYEYGRLIGSITLQEGVEPTYIQFVNGYSVIILSDTLGQVHLLKFIMRDSIHIKIKRIGYIKLLYDNHKTPFITEDHYNSGNHDHNNTNNGIFGNKLLVDINYNELDTKTKKPLTCKLYVSTNKGDIKQYDLMPIFNNNMVEYTPHANTRSNYNAERSCVENFEKSMINLKIYNYNVGKIHEQQQQLPHHAKTLSNVTNEDQERKISLGMKNSVHSQKLFFADEDHNGNEMDLSQYCLLEFPAHKDTLTTLSLMLCPENKLLTSSLDGYLKIWELDGTLLGSYNINHPLPILWNLKFERGNKSKKRILYAMKVIDILKQRYNNSLSSIDENNTNINKFLAKLETAIDNENKPTNNEKNILANLNRVNGSKSVGSKRVNSYSQEKKVFLMKDEYSPRDLQYNSVKGIYQKELQGPSLRQMENSKRLNATQKMWKEEKRRNEKRSDINHEDFREKCADFMNYLLGDEKIGFHESSRPNSNNNTLVDKIETLFKNRDKIKSGAHISFPADKLGLSKNFSSISNFGKLNANPMKSPRLQRSGLKSRRDSSSSEISNDLIRSDLSSKLFVQAKPKAPSNNNTGSNNEEQSISFVNKVKSTERIKMDPSVQIKKKRSAASLTKIPPHADLKKSNYIFEYASKKIVDYEPAPLENTKNTTNTKKYMAMTDQNFWSHAAIDRKTQHSEFHKLLGVLNERVKQSVRGNSSINEIQIQPLLKKQSTVTSIVLDNVNSSDNIDQALPNLKKSFFSSAKNSIVNLENRPTRKVLPKINIKDDLEK